MILTFLMTHDNDIWLKFQSVNKVLLAYTPQLIFMLICLWHSAESNSSDNIERKAWNILSGPSQKMFAKLCSELYI